MDSFSEGKTPPNARSGKASSQEAFMSDRIVDSLALSSYLKLRQENRSPHISTTGSAVKQSFHSRELFEEFRFEENQSVDGDYTLDAAGSDHSLSFTENVTDVSELDFKAMRLLVHTSMHEKVVAQSKVAGLQDDISHLSQLNARFRNPRMWQLPLSIIHQGIKMHCNQKARYFHKWKGKLVTQKFIQHHSEKERFTLLLARRNILKVRTVYLSRAFNRWSLQHKHALDAVDSYGLKTAIRHRHYSLQAMFKVMRARRVQRKWLRRLNRIGRVCLFRSYLAHWKRCTTASYRVQCHKLQQSTSFAALAHSLRASREQVRSAFQTWLALVHEERNRAHMHTLAQQRLRHIYNRYTSPTAYAFGQWRHVTVSFYPKVKNAVTVWSEAVRNSRKFQMRKALATWKEKILKFMKIGKRIAGYLQSRAECSLRSCFAKLVAAQQEHLRQRAKSGVNRWIRRFFISVDTANELTCRSVLSARFRHWHHTTHTDRSLNYYEGRLQDVQGALRRTETSLQDEQHRRQALLSKSHAETTALQARIAAAKLVFMGRILRNMQQGAKGRGFRRWVQFSHWRSHQESMAQLELTERTTRVRESLLRWSKHTETLNLSAAIKVWRFTCTRLAGIDSIVKKRHAATSKSYFHWWSTQTRNHKLQKKVLKRMGRTKKQALLHLAWEKWHHKVTFLKNKCKQFVRLLLSKRHLQCKLALDKWKQSTQKGILNAERVVRQRLESSERHLSLRLFWDHFQFGLSQWHAHKVRTIQLVVSKITARVRDGFDRWFHSTQRQHRLRTVCSAMLRRYAHSLGKQHLLAFARWKAVVWDYQKVSYQNVQDRLTEAYDRIHNITNQQLVLETSAEHLKAHNDRSDRIARALYHQVHRMLHSRRTFALVKLMFDSWKHDHLVIKHIKSRFKAYITRTLSSSNKMRTAAAFKTWVLETHLQAKAEKEQGLILHHHNHIVLRRSFDHWQAYRQMIKTKMISVIIRLKTGLQVGNQKTLIAGFIKWRDYTRSYAQYRETMLEKYFEQWSESVKDNIKKKKVIFRLFPKLNAANVALYFKKWKANARILGLLSNTIMRMMEVSRLNRTYVSTVRLRACWNRWHRTVAFNANQMKACRMVVQCYRKILRTAVFTWRINCDYHHSALQVRRMAMKKLLQMARFHMLNRFFRWKVATHHLKQSEEHVEKMGVVLKRLRFIRRKRRAWGAWKFLFLSISTPAVSSVATLKLNGPKYANAITRAQYWSSTLLRGVLTNTSLEPVLHQALEAIHSILPELTPSLYYLHHEHSYLQGFALRTGTQRRSESPSNLDRTATALKQLHLSRRFSPVPHDHTEHCRGGDVGEYFPHSQTLRFADERNNLFGETPFRSTHSAPPSSLRKNNTSEAAFSPAPASRSYLQESARERGPESARYTSPDQSRRTADESTTILLGEGVVGRCAQQRCLQVYRQAVITDGVYSQKRMYCSMNVPVPEDASNINVNPNSLETKDSIATCVLPIVWGGNVVAVLQLTSPELDPAGVFYDADRIHSGDGPAGMSQEQKSKALKQMSVTLRDIVDFSDVNADQEFATSFTVDASMVSTLGTTQSLTARARTLRGQMMYQLMQLCLELRLDEERSVAFMSLVSTVAEIFGRHFPTGGVSAAAEEHTQQEFLNSTLHSLQRSPSKADFTLPSPHPSAHSSARSTHNGSFVGLAHYYSKTTTELHQTDTLHRTLVSETESLSHIVEKLKRSREKYLHKSEQLQHELDSSLQSLELERSTNKKLSHSIKKAEARLRAFDQQQIEIERLNSYMRSAAKSALN